MTRGVLYWSVGDRHTEHFIVSLLSLRDHWKGPVAVVVGDEASRSLAERCQDSLGPLDIIDFDYQAIKRRHRKNAHYLSKCYLHRHSPFDETVFLDLDTLVLGGFDEVFPTNDEIVLTQFSTWQTTGGIIRGRISPWRHVCPVEVAMMTANPYPAINTGVFGFSKGTEKYMLDWERTTEQRVVFMADELSAQLIFVRYPHRVLDDRFNWSPKYSAPNPDCRIAHGHGFKFHKTKTGKRLWVPFYERAKALNIAGMRDWAPTKKFAPYYS